MFAPFDSPGGITTKEFDAVTFHKILGVSKTEHRANQSIDDELGVSFGTLLNFIKKTN